MEDILKKFIIILCITFICTFSVLAQNQQEEKTETLPQTKNELHFKMGMFPYTESIVGSLASIGNTGDSFALPVFSVQYLYYVDPQVGLGASFSTGVPIVVTGEYNTSIMYTSLQFKIRGIYSNKEKIKLYGELGVGGELLFSLIKETEFFTPFVSGSLVPLGIWFGSDELFGTAELSFGSEGTILTVGCGFRF
jgi:hypothetical protein